jgi:hypothetical protein
LCKGSTTRAFFVPELGFLSAEGSVFEETLVAEECFDFLDEVEVAEGLALRFLDLVKDPARPVEDMKAVKKEARCKTYEGRLDFGPNCPIYQSGFVIATYLGHAAGNLSMSCPGQTAGVYLGSKPQVSDINQKQAWTQRITLVFASNTR